MSDVVLTERDDAVAVVRLNRPEVRNALSAELLETLALTLEALDADPDVRCIVLAGGDEYFAAGADIRAMSERTFAEALTAGGQRVWERMAACRTPMVAAVSMASANVLAVLPSARRSVP